MATLRNTKRLYLYKYMTKNNYFLVNSINSSICQHLSHHLDCHTYADHNGNKFNMILLFFLRHPRYYPTMFSLSIVFFSLFKLNNITQGKIPHACETINRMKYKMCNSGVTLSYSDCIGLLIECFQLSRVSTHMIL